MIPPKLKRRMREIWRESAKRLTFGGLKKTAVIVLILGLNWAGIAAIGQTVSYFNDEENSFDNVLAAGSLDIVLTASPSAGFSPEEKANYILPGDFVVREIEVSNNGSLEPEYDVAAAFAYSDPFCNALSVKAELNGALKYEDLLKDFSLVSVASISGGLDEWQFSVGLPDGSKQFKDSTCEFSFVFRGHQDELPFGQGFYDEEKVDGVLTGGGEVVMNEFLPNPEGADDQQGLLGEWVEFYNNSSRPIDLTGWYIKDKAGHKKVISSANTLNGQTIIGPKGSGSEWLVLFMNDDILNNTSSDGGELVSFYNNSDKLMDQYGYFQSVNDSDSQSDNTPGSQNSFSGAEQSAQEGKSYARIPDGIGNWVDPVPTPGGPNKLVKTSEENELENVIAIEEQTASPSFSETLGAAASTITEFVSGGEEAVTSPSAETVADAPDLAPVASESVEPSLSSSPEPSPETSPEPSVTPEPPLDSPAGDDLTGQALPSPEASPEISPEPSPEISPSPEPTVIPEPTGTPAAPSSDGASLAPEGREPAIPIEPVTVEVPTEPASPPADPPLPTSPSENLGGQAAPAPEQASAPAEAPAPAPEAPAAPAE